MLEFLLRWVLQFRLLVLALGAGLLGVGVAVLPGMPVDAYPEFSPPQVEIQTEALGLSAVEVEQLITSPMEADLLNGVAWVDAIRSKSVPGLSSIQMVFKPGTDLLRARQLVAERLTQARALPNVSAPPVLMQPVSSTSRVMMVRLTSKSMSAIDMSVLARWTMKPGLLAVPGVANVSIWGQRDHQLQVLVDPARLKAKGVTLDEVIRTAGNSVWVSPLSYLEASTPGTGGFLETQHQRLGVQHVLPITTPKDLGRISLEGQHARPVTLGDVAAVETDHQPLIGDALLDNEAGLMLVIEKFPNANTLDVTKGVDEELEALQPGLAGVTIDSNVYRQAAFVQDGVGALAVAVPLTLLLVAAALGLLFRSWRMAFVGFVAILVALVAAALVLMARGSGLNSMAFAGLALALAVIVGDVAEDLDRHRAPAAAGSGSGTPRAIAAFKAVRTPLFYSSLIMVLAVAPVLFVPGENGALLGTLVSSYVVALLTSLATALTVTASLVFLLVPRGTLSRRPLRFVRRSALALRRLASRAAAGLRWAPVAAAAVALAGLALAPLLVPSTGAVVPALADRTLVVHWNAIAGTSDGEMNRITEAAARELRSLPGVAAVGGHIGRAVTSDQVADVSSGEIWVTMTGDAPYESTQAAVTDVVKGYPGLSSSVSTYPVQRLQAVQQEADSAFIVRVYGVDLAVMRQKAEEIRGLLARTAGVSGATVDSTAAQPIAEVRVDLGKAQKVGIKPGDVRRAAAALLQGIEVGNLYEQQKVFQVIVKGNQATRNSLTSVRDLLIDTPSGGHVRLGAVASVNMVGNEAVILHDDTSRRVDVRAAIQGRPYGEVENDVKAALARVQFPLAYHAEVLPQYAQQQSDTQWLWWLAGLAAAGILVLLQTALGSWRLAALVAVVALISLAGGVLAALAAGGVQSLVPLGGFVVVLGFAVRSALMLLARVRELQRQSPGRPPAGLIRRAAGERAWPTVATAVLTMLALLPLVLFGGDAGRSLIGPIAVIVAGGVLTSVLVGLFVLPAMVAAHGLPDAGDDSSNRPEASRLPVMPERSDVP